MYVSVLCEYGGHAVQDDGAHTFVPRFFTLTKTQSINIALENVEALLGMQMKASLGIIDRG